MSTKNRNIIKKKKKKKKKKKTTKKQHDILKRLLRLDIAKRMYRHNENDECSVFYFLVYITCVSPIC